MRHIRADIVPARLPESSCLSLQFLPKQQIAGVNFMKELLIDLHSFSFASLTLCLLGVGVGRLFTSSGF